ncbi:MAG: F-type H+-transporting ATPase subunit delta [Paracoccaceae bacterium]
MDVSEPASISNGIAKRYATAVFELATEGNALGVLETDIDALDAALAESADLRDLINSPIFSRDEMQAAIGGVADAMNLSATTGNTLRLMASNRRLFVVPALIRALRVLISNEKGEVTADVTSAKALTKTQADKLAKALTANIGKDVKLNATVDENLIGGLVVKVGSKMIDTSIRSKLNSLQNTMKEVG